MASSIKRVSELRMCFEAACTQVSKLVRRSKLDDSVEDPLDLERQTVKKLQTQLAEQQKITEHLNMAINGLERTFASHLCQALVKAANTPYLNPESKSFLATAEEELKCHICHEIVLDPLTLVNCLHNFCGACMKETFRYQRMEAFTRGLPTSQNPYRCPVCRTGVRGARPNAAISTLSHSFLTLHPDKQRPAKELEAMKDVYKPGDKVLQGMYSSTLPLNEPGTSFQVDVISEEEERLRSELVDTVRHVAGIMESSAAIEPGVITYLGLERVADRQWRWGLVSAPEAHTYSGRLIDALVAATLTS